MNIFEKIKKFGREVVQEIKLGNGPHFHCHPRASFEVCSHQSQPDGQAVDIQGIRVGRSDPFAFSITSLEVDPDEPSVRTKNTLFVPTKPDRNKRLVMRYKVRVPTRALIDGGVIFLDDIVEGKRQASNNNPGEENNSLLSKPER